MVPIAPIRRSRSGMIIAMGKCGIKGHENLLCAKLDCYQVNDAPDLGTRAEGSGQRRRHRLANEPIYAAVIGSARCSAPNRVKPQKSAMWRVEEMPTSSMYLPSSPRPSSPSALIGVPWPISSMM